MPTPDRIQPDEAVDEFGPSPMHFNLRYAFTHMIEATARHCGHPDLLREAIDGVRGE